MDSLKTVKNVHLKALITGAAERHAEMHNGIAHKAMNSHERRLLHQQDMEAQLKLNPALGKGGAS